MTITECAATFKLPGYAGTAFVQSRRSWKVGEEWLEGDGLYAYSYRLSMADLVATRDVTPCIVAMHAEIGTSYVPLDFDEDGAEEDLFEIEHGSPGDVLLSTAKRVRNVVSFEFAEPICAGQTSHFVGVASRAEPRNSVPVTISLDDGEELLLQACMGPQLV